MASLIATTQGVAAGLLEQNLTPIRQAAQELIEVASVIRARTTPLPDFVPPTATTTSSTSTLNADGGGGGGAQQSYPFNTLNNQNQNNNTNNNATSNLLASTGADTGTAFALPVSTNKLLQYIQTLSANMDSFIKVGIVVESIADACWTLISHVVTLATTAVNAEYSSYNNITTSANNSTSSTQQQQQQASSSLVFTSVSTQRSARTAFLAQAPLISSCVALWDSLSKRFTPKIFHSPIEQGKQDLVSWCERMTSVYSSPAFSTSSVTQEASSSSSSSSSSSKHNNINLLSTPSVSLPSVITFLLGSDPESNLDAQKFELVYVDAVIALWTLLETVCNCLERRLVSRAKVVSNRVDDSAVFRLGDVSEFYSSAASYFLGQNSRNFVKRSNNNGTTLRWSHIAVMTFIPIVHEYFDNGHEVQQQFFLEHVPDVLSEKLELEQISVLCSFLFHRVSDSMLVFQQHQSQQQKNASKTIEVNARNIGKLASSLRSNNVLLSTITLALQQANDDDQERHFISTPSSSSSSTTTMKSAKTTTTATTKMTFERQPVQMFAACLVSLLTVPLESDGLASGSVHDFDSTMELLSLCFRRCILDSTTTTNSPTPTTPSAAMARLFFVSLVQKLDILKRTAAVQRGFAPWDNRFRLFSSLSKYHNAFLVEQMNRIMEFQQHQHQQQKQSVVVAKPEQQQHNQSIIPSKISFTLLLSKIMMEWVFQTLLTYPAKTFFQSPLLERKGKANNSNGNLKIVSNSPFVLILRAELLRCVTNPFVDIADVVAAQNPDCAHVVALTLLKALMIMKPEELLLQGSSFSPSSSSSTANPQDLERAILLKNISSSSESKNIATAEPRNYNNQLAKSAIVVAPASTVSATMETVSQGGGVTMATASAIISTAVVSASSSSDQANLQQQKNNNSKTNANQMLSLLYYTNFQQFILVRANQCIAMTEKILRSAFTVINAAEPWGKLVPRRLYAETSLTLYDVIALAFSALAGDALQLRNNNDFVLAMMKVTRQLIPLAQPFCRAALESPATVNDLIDRFEKSMLDVESGNFQLAKESQTRTNNGNNNKLSSVQIMTFRYLVASFTLSGMTDQQGMRVMPSDVFAGRWIPLLSRACNAIESNETTRNLLEVHCRNCCSALLRSRRTVSPPSHNASAVSLYAGTVTTNNFLTHVSTFLTWIIRPIITPPRTAIGRRMAGVSFASTFAPCIFSVERLENEQGDHVGRDLCRQFLTDAGRALVTQIRHLTPRIQDNYQREIYMDGSTKFAEGVASCVACLDAGVRSVVQYFADLILSSLLVVFSMESKRRVRDTMATAIGQSKHLRGEEHREIAMWVCENEMKWLKEDGSVLMSDKLRGTNPQVAARFGQAKL